LNRSRVLFGLNASVFVMMLGVGLIVAILPGKILALTGSPSMVGMLASTFALSYILLQVPVGNLADRWGFRPFLFWGYLLCAFVGLGYAFAPSALLIFAGRVLQGAGEAPVWALGPAVLSIAYPEKKGTVIGFYNAASHLGLTFGPLLGVLLAGRWTEGAPFLFYAGTCAVGAGIIALTLGKVRPALDPSRARLNLQTLRALTLEAGILKAFFGIALHGVAYGIVLTVIPAYVIAARHFSQASVNVYFSLFHITVCASQFLTGSLSDRGGRRPLMAAGLILTAAGIASIPVLPSPWIFGAFAILSFGLGTFYLSSMAFLNETVPDTLKGTISGAYFLFWGIGNFAGPPLVGLVAQALGQAAGFEAFAATLALQAVLVMRKETPGLGPFSKKKEA
jgi:MFS family permease